MSERRPIGRRACANISRGVPRVATRCTPWRALVRAAAGAFLTLAVLAAAACRGETRSDRDPATASPRTRAEHPAEADSVQAQVHRVLTASRDALQRLDVEAFLELYDTGPDLLVVDPAGEFEGREAFERHVRAWFAGARRRGASYGVVTARERVRALGPGLAAAVFHWSAPGAEGPYRSLLILRRTADGWRIAAEHSAPVPQEPGPPADGP